MANQSMTKENVDYTVAHFQGNFKGFQGYVESRKVSFTFRCLSFCRFDLSV